MKLIDFFNNFNSLYSKDNVSIKVKNDVIDLFLEKTTKKSNDFYFTPIQNKKFQMQIKKNCLSPFNKLKKKPNIFSFENNLSRGAKKSSSAIIKEPILKYRRKILVSFGVSKYKEWPDLDNANYDVKSISEFFRNKLKFDYVCTYYDDKVTKSNFEKIITNELYQISGPNDLIVISFHGHGKSIKFKNHSEGFLIPFDSPEEPTPFHLISMNDLSKWFMYIKTRHVLILLDCCCSGLSAVRNKDKELKELNDNAIITHLNSTSRIIINAGTTDQEVSDGGWGKNSIFTGSIISSPIFDNTVGSVFNLYYYLLKTIPKFSNQTPSIGKLQGDQGTDIFLNL